MQDKLGRENYINVYHPVDSAKSKLQDSLKRDEAIEEIKKSSSFVLISAKDGNGKCTCVIDETDRKEILSGIIILTETLLEE